MSRIGKKEIVVPEKTEVTISEDLVTVKGPLGELKMEYLPVIQIKNENSVITTKPLKDDIETTALWGTYSSIIDNMIQGVNKEFEKKLVIEGVGYRVEMRGDALVFSLGFSHQVELKIPEGVKATVEKNNVTISGIDKQKVGQFAAVIRSKKKPEPYKGKGIRYADEVIRRKEGKKTV